MSFDYIENLPMNEILSLYDDVIEDNTLKADYNEIICENGIIGYSRLPGDGASTRGIKAYNYAEYGYWCNNYSNAGWHVCRVCGSGVKANTFALGGYGDSQASDCAKKGGTMFGEYTCKIFPK